MRNASITRPIVLAGSCLTTVSEAAHFSSGKPAPSMLRGSALWLLLLLCVFMSACDTSNSVVADVGNGRWEVIRQNLHDVWYHDICFVDNSHGWVVGDTGTVLHTDDGGLSWQAQNSMTQNSLLCVLFVDMSDGWVAGSRGTVLHTSDGGVSWHPQTSTIDTSSTVLTMSFIDPTTGWFGTNHGEILHTVDGGVSWARQQSGTPWAITSIYFHDSMKGWATGTNRIVLQTSDGGVHWSVQNVPAPTPSMFTAMHFADAYTGWIATTMLASSAIQTTSPLLRTTNAGFAWSVQGQVPEIHVTSLHFMSPTRGWAIGMHGIWHTNDAGESWSCKYEGSTDPLVGLSFVGEANGWALGFGGTVLRYRMN